MLSKIQNLLYSCYGENTGDKIPDIRFQLFLISVKSLMPYEDNIGCFLDRDRYIKETDLLKLYINGHDDCIENYFKNKRPYEGEDSLIEYKIMPIAIANIVWENLIEEVMRTTFFYSLNKRTIINSILTSSALYDYLSDENIDIENINLNAKERLIQFSIKEFFEKHNIILDKMSIIDFEKERIKTITRTEIYSEECILKSKTLQHIINNVSPIEKDYNNDILSSYSAYLLKLRKGTISPEKLKIGDGKIPELKEFLKYNSFSHPLLGKCNIVRRTEKEIILRNKTGLMKVNI
ncbi:MAG: hypothetical protein K0Q47_1403 [Sedimentibacter sp.]|jgi:hypothetical protein|nr:hypothetical protein [Sedimentibacter sp.]